MGRVAQRSAQVSAADAETNGVGTRRRRPEAEDLLRMAEYRRSMHALRRAAVKAATEASVTAAARPVAAPSATGNVLSLADARAKRAGHPAGRAALETC
jgi:hypothetical protein